MHRQEALQMRELFMKLAFHTSCSDAKSYGFSNWHYLTRFLSAVRANLLRISVSDSEENANKGSCLG